MITSDDTDGRFASDYGTYQLINPKTKIIALQPVGQVQEWVDDFLSDRDAISFEASAVQCLATETDPTECAATEGVR